MTRKLWMCLIAVALLWGMWTPRSGAQTPTVWYVNGSLPSNGGGQSWGDAFNNLQSALTQAQPDHDPPDQIWVTSATYKPQVPDPPADPRTAIFAIPSGVEVYGGFAGGEDELGDRRPDLNVTVLSGDIGEPGLASDNCNCVVLITQWFLASRLDGFTVREGYGGWLNGGSGAGVYIDSEASPTIANCRITHCTVPDWGKGGGMYCGWGSSPIVTAVSFENNRAGFGAALYVEPGSSSIYSDRCVFIGNRAKYYAAALMNGGYLFSSINTAFIGNVTAGGVPGQEGGGAVTNIGGAAQYVNCLFHRNSSLGDGSAMWNASGSNVNIVNSTVAFNTCICGQGGGLYVQGGTTSVVNSVLWGNIDTDRVSDEAAQIHVNAGSCGVTYTCIQGKYLFNDPSNTGLDPQFRDPDGPDNVLGTLDDDLRPSGNPFSPCIDKGDSQQISEVYDLDSLDRTVNGDGLGGDEVDMGAYEYQGAVVDCNRNGISDALDILNSTSQDCQPNGIPDECDIASGASNDCNGNGVPDECASEGLTPDCNHDCQGDLFQVPYSSGCPSGSCTAPGCLKDDNENCIPDACEFSLSGRWTDDADFDAGTLINVNHGTPGQLQRNTVQTTAPLPYIWVAASGRGSVVRVDTEGGQVLGEYRTAPLQQVLDCSVSTANPDPSRTTVDLDGSVWVANRGDNVMIDGTEFGSVAKIGLVIGGQRVDARGTPDPTGQYLAPPFDYCTCEDRDGNGLIRTSRGLGDILWWDNADGRDSDGGVQTAEDECILRYVRTAGTGTRTVAIDKDNDVWTGGTGNLRHEKVDGFTGVPVAGTQFQQGCGGYGGLVAQAFDEQLQWHEFLWSARGGNGLLRLNTTTQVGDCSNSLGDYGLGFDPLTGRIWQSSASFPYQLHEIDPWEMSSFHAYNQAFETNGPARGVAVDNNGDVWLAENGDDEVLRYRAPNPWSADSLHQEPPVSISGFSNPTGVAIDRAGRVWITEMGADRITRCDPNDYYSLLRVPLGFNAAPYNYSDMTGIVGLHTSGTGTWIVTHDGGREETEWCRVVWNQEPGCPGVPQGTKLQVSVRAHDNEAQLPSVDYTPVASSGAPLTGIVGRFIQVRVRFFATVPGVAPYRTPVLCDLAVTPLTRCLKGDMNADGLVDRSDYPLFIYALDTVPTPAILLCPADMDGDGIVTKWDLDCFLAILGGDPLACRPVYADCTDGPGGGDGFTNDCDENGVLDAVDAFLGTSQDCNANGILDSCDIASQFSLDENQNGIPDECEGENQMDGAMQGDGLLGGDGYLFGPCAGLPPEQWFDDPICAAAWEEFSAWLMAQDWGPDSGLTGAEQFQMMLSKLQELGLPLGEPPLP